MPKKSLKINLTKRHYHLLATSIILFVLYYMFWQEFWNVIGLEALFGSLSYISMYIVIFLSLLVIAIIPSYVVTKMVYSKKMSAYIADRALFGLIYIVMSILSVAIFMIRTS